MRLKLSAALFLVSLGVLAQSNSWQGLHPFRNNYKARTASSLPQASNIVFRHDLFDGNSTPQVSTVTYTRTGSMKAASSASLLSEYGANTLPYAMRYGGTETLKGAWFGGAVVNLLLRSEELENAAWTSIDSAGATANQATSPDGTLTADLISGPDAGDGIQQSAGAIAVSATYMFSVWLRSVSGTQEAQIVVKDGGVEGNVTRCYLTTAWKKFNVPYEFSASATGNVAAQIIIGDAAGLYAWGAQLENWKSNATGKRQRWGTPNQYVKTTTATATSGNSRYEIPNSAVSQIADRGSIAFWIYPEYDFTDLSTIANNPYLFSINGEILGLATNGRDGLIFWYNNNNAIDLTTSADFNGVHGLAPFRWNHVVVTYDSNPDSYKIYINGSLKRTTTTALTAPTIGANTMNFGGYDASFADLGADAVFSQIVIWKSVLTADQVSAVYGLKDQDATRTPMGTGKIFEVSLGTSLIPTTGDVGYAAGVRRRSEVPIYYPDSTTTLAATSSTVFPIGARPLGGFNKGGYYFTGPQTNHILQAESIATTWTTTGLPTVTANVGTFLGTLSYGTILSAGLGDGIRQSLATAAASTAWTGSVYGSVGSGTLAARLTIQGDSGGTPETTNCDITLTTTPQRFHCYASFTGSATGNVRFEFTNQAVGTARVGGFMLEKAGGTGVTSYWKKAAAYIKTTTTSKTSGWNQIIYDAVDSFNPEKGTAIAWVFLWYDPSTDSLSSDGPTLIAAPGQTYNFYWTIAHTGDYTLWYGGVGPMVQDANRSLTAGTWYQLATTWELSTGTYRLYLDGSQVATATNGTAATMLPRKIIIGGDHIFGLMDFTHGGTDKVTIYGDVNATAISNDWTNTKASYGR